MPAKKHPEEGSIAPCIVNPLIVTLSAKICTGPQGWSMIDWVVGSGTNGRVLASINACAPSKVKLFLLIWTCSAYRPGQTLIVSPGIVVGAFIAAWIDV